MSGQYHPLISRNWNGSTGQALRPAGDASNGFYPVQPIVPVDLGSNSSEVTFIIAAFGAQGAPTAWSLGAKFQFCIPTDTSFQYAKEIWYDADEANIAGCVVEKCGFAGPGKTPPVDGGFGVIADESSGATSDTPIVVMRTIKHFGLRVRVALDLQFTGGSNPGIFVDMGYFRRQG